MVYCLILGGPYGRKVCMNLISSLDKDFIVIINIIIKLINVIKKESRGKEHAFYR